jgi:hypothetical protein
MISFMGDIRFRFLGCLIASVVLASLAHTEDKRSPSPLQTKPDYEVELKIQSQSVKAGTESVRFSVSLCNNSNKEVRLTYLNTQDEYFVFTVLNAEGNVASRVDLNAFISPIASTLNWNQPKLVVAAGKRMSWDFDLSHYLGNVLTMPGTYRVIVSFRSREIPSLTSRPARLIVTK